MISAEIVADTVFQEDRITTIQCRYHRYLDAQFEKHRMISSNGRSSRAVPTFKLLEEVVSSPAYPTSWRKSGSGMQAHGDMNTADSAYCKLRWDLLAQEACKVASFLCDKGLAKETVNRLLEPFMWIDKVITFTSFAPSLRGSEIVEIPVLESFLKLRDHNHAQPEIRALAKRIRQAVEGSQPNCSQYHVPYVTKDELKELPIATALAVSSARCARVSYKPFDSDRVNMTRDIELAEKMWKADPPHGSAFEHAAKHLTGYWANKKNWCDARILLRPHTKESDSSFTLT